MLLTAYNIYRKKSKIIERCIDEEQYVFLDVASELENPFYSSFFEHLIYSTINDAYEFFVELDCQNNFFYENLELMSISRGHRFFKLVAMYNTIRFSRKKRKLVDANGLRESIFKVYAFNEREEKLYDLLYTCNLQYEGEFEPLFANTVAKYLFNLEISSPFTLAFIENFCYNSYSSFIGSLSKYISINRRMKLANKQL